MSEMRDILEHIMEVDTDPFVPADPEEVDKRKTVEKKRREEARKKWDKIVAKNEEIIGKGPKVWREFADQVDGDIEIWPETYEERRCPVCGALNSLEILDTEYEDTQLENICECQACGSSVSMFYQNTPTYDYSRVYAVPEPDEQVEESINEEDETDPFVPAKQEDIDARKTKVDKARLARGIDICPHCQADLREVGVDQDGISYETTSMSYQDGMWREKIPSQYDYQETDAYCRGCRECIGKRGENYDSDYI